MVRSSIGRTARADLPVKDVEIIGVDCSSAAQIVQWTQVREGFPVSYVKTDSSSNALRIEFPASVTGGASGVFYEITEPDGAVEFAVVDGEVRRLDDNELPDEWSETAPGLVEKATIAEASNDALMPWGTGTTLSHDLGMTPEATRALVETNYVIRTNKFYAVGPSGAADFANLNEAYEFLNGKVILDRAIVTLQLEAGDIIHNSPVRIHHPYGHQIRILGATMTGAAPDFSDLTGVEADDRALLRSRFGSRIVFENSTGGLYIMTACRSIENVLIEAISTGSYGVFVGYDAEYSSGASVTLRNCSIHGFGNSGVIATRNSSIGISGKCISCHNTYYGFYANRGGAIYSSGDRFLQGLYNGSRNFIAQYDASIDCSSIVSLGGKGVLVSTNSRLYSTNSQGLIDGSTSQGIYVRDGSTARFTGEISNSVDSGISCIFSSMILANGSTVANSSGTSAVYTSNHSYCYFNGSTLAPTGNQQIYASEASFVRATGVIGTPSYSPAPGTAGNYNAYIRT